MTEASELLKQYGGLFLNALVAYQDVHRNRPLPERLELLAQCLVLGRELERFVQSDDERTQPDNPIPVRATTLIEQVRQAYSLYLKEYGLGYDETTFLQFVALVLLDNDAPRALNRAARNIGGLSFPPFARSPKE